MADDIEELLKIVGSSSDIPVTNKSKDPSVLVFITNNGIVQGTGKIPQDILYAKYVSVTYEPLPEKVFLKQFRNYFKQKRTNSARYYELDPSPFNLPAGFSIYKKEFGYLKPNSYYVKAEREQDNEQEKDNKEDQT